MSDANPTNAIAWETPNCPLCGESRSSPIFGAGDLLYRNVGEFTLASCNQCRHVFLNPRPTCECIGQFYPADYGPFRGQGAGVGGQGTGKGRLEFKITSPRSCSWLRRLVLWWIDSRAAPIPKPVQTGSGSQPLALELGCASGSFLEQLQTRGWKCVGVEPAKAVAMVARQREFDVRVGSLESVVAADRQTFSAERFDAIFAWMVVEHLHDPVATLRLACELLKPGGHLLLSVPNFGCWERRAFGRYWYALQLPTHLQHFTTTSLRRLVETAGFELAELIHQRNVNNLVGTLGLWLRVQFPRWSLGERLIRWTDNPTALALCVLAPLARALAAIRQAGRLTLIARKPDK